MILESWLEAECPKCGTAFDIHPLPRSGTTHRCCGCGKTFKVSSANAQCIGITEPDGSGVVFICEWQAGHFPSH
jgi:hypothetical protein